MYVRRYARIRFLTFFSQTFGFLFQHFKDRINERKAKACFLAFPSAKGFRGAASKSTVIFPFPFVDSAKVGIKKEPYPLRNGYA